MTRSDPAKLPDVCSRSCLRQGTVPFGLRPGRCPGGSVRGPPVAGFHGHLGPPGVRAFLHDQRRACAPLPSRFDPSPVQHHLAPRPCHLGRDQAVRSGPAGPTMERGRPPGLSLPTTRVPSEDALSPFEVSPSMRTAPWKGELAAGSWCPAPRKALISSLAMSSPLAGVTQHPRACGQGGVTSCLNMNLPHGHVEHNAHAGKN